MKVTFEAGSPNQLVVRNSNLPHHVAVEVQRLPEDVQNRFYFEYSDKKKNVAIAYVLHVIPGIPSVSYAYLGKWGKQILYWLTMGGMGVWWLANFFRLPKLVKQKNTKIAEELLLKYMRSQPHGRTLKKNPSGTAKQLLDIPYDPSRISPSNLDVGFLLDYNLKTWHVNAKRQLDWSTGESELEFHISTGLERNIIHARTSAFNQSVTICSEVSLTLLGLNEQMLNPMSLQKTLYYQGQSFFLDKQLSGHSYVGDSDHGQQIMLFHYLDESRIFCIRVERSAGDIRALIGQEIQPEHISDILPGE